MECFPFIIAIHNVMHAVRLLIIQQYIPILRGWLKCGALCWCMALPQSLHEWSCNVINGSVPPVLALYGVGRMSFDVPLLLWSGVKLYMQYEHQWHIKLFIQSVLNEMGQEIVIVPNYIIHYTLYIIHLFNCIHSSTFRHQVGSSSFSL